MRPLGEPDELLFNVRGQGVIELLRFLREREDVLFAGHHQNGDVKTRKTIQGSILFDVEAIELLNPFPEIGDAGVGAYLRVPADSDP